MPHKTLMEIWNREAQAAMAAVEAGAAKGLWKVSAQGVVLAVIEVPDGDVLDQVVASLPIMQEMGPSVRIEPWPIREYAHFADDLQKAVTGS